MTQKLIPVWSFQVPALLFLVAAVIPVLKGGRLNLTLVVLAAVFATLSVALAARQRPRKDSPPNA